MKHKFIKHKNNLDVCFQIINYDEFDVFVDIWNMGQTKAYYIGETMKFPIVKLYDGNWDYAENAEDILKNNMSLRKATWKSLNV
jgi:hypothetical protein